MSEFTPHPELEKLTVVRKEGIPFGQRQNRLVRPCRMAPTKRPMITVKDRWEQHRRISKVKK